TSIGNLAQLAWFMRRRVGALEGARTLNMVARVTIASLLVALLCAGQLALLPLAAHGVWGRAATIAIAGLIAVAAGYGLLKLLGVEEVAALEDLARAVGRRLRGR